MADRLDGFAEFVAAHRRGLSRMAYLLTGDHSAAEELVQSALVKTAAHWRRLADDGSPEAYVRRVMLNERASWWRRRSRIDERSTASVPDRPARDEVGAAVDRLALAAALTRLSQRQRAVLYLRFYEDRSEADTARLLGCSTGTVKRHTSDALHRLRTLAPELLADTPEATR
jgi:RNA polymerase sigma-70 factor (sigma-E family)